MDESVDNSCSSGGLTISMLSITSNVRSNITGLEGVLSQTETVVASYGLLRITLPAAVATTISPLDKPLTSGNKIMRERPNSSTVQVKSVPRIVISAVGVESLIFFLSIFPNLLLINLAVPLANLRAIFPLAGLGS